MSELTASIIGSLLAQKEQIERATRLKPDAIAMPYRYAVHGDPDGNLHQTTALFGIPVIGGEKFSLVYDVHVEGVE